MTFPASESAFCQFHHLPAPVTVCLHPPQPIYTATVCLHPQCPKDGMEVVVPPEKHILLPGRKMYTGGCFEELIHFRANPQGFPVRLEIDRQGIQPNFDISAQTTSLQCLEQCYSSLEISSGWLETNVPPMKQQGSPFGSTQVRVQDQRYKFPSLKHSLCVWVQGPKPSTIQPLSAHKRGLLYSTGHSGLSHTQNKGSEKTMQICP